jgi:hypothetical protein
LSKLAKTDVVAIDDWGLAPMTDMERRHFLEVLEDRCEVRSTILTSQYPVKTWHDLVGSPTLADAIMERVLSNSHKIELMGETMRPVNKEPGGSETKGSLDASSKKHPDQDQRRRNHDPVSVDPQESERLVCRRCRS